MLFYIITYFLCVCNALLLTHDSPRRVVKILEVTNGDPWGQWDPPQYCASGHFAIGFNMKIEDDQGRGRDDTALNGILLSCGSSSGQYGGYVSSGYGPWGRWMGDTTCEIDTAQKYLTAFALQVEEPRGGNIDDTAVNYIKFKCRNFDNGTEYELNHPPGYGVWGSFGQWSESCPLESAICGIQTKVEGDQGSGSDDTALNDVKFFCCSQ